jgi:hypothetical protein
VTTISPTRHVELDGVDNFRDLGGYPARDGRTMAHHVPCGRAQPADHRRHRTHPPAGAAHRDRSPHRRRGFAAAITLLADAEAVPAVFHCAAGKDRTGLLAALVLGALGVDRDAIVADDALTKNSMDVVLARAASDPVKAAAIAHVPPSFFSADPIGMDRVLDDIERAHGTVRGYVRSIGVTDPTLEHLDALLLTS